MLDHQHKKLWTSGLLPCPCLLRPTAGGLRARPPGSILLGLQLGSLRASPDNEVRLVLGGTAPRAFASRCRLGRCARLP